MPCQRVLTWSPGIRQPVTGSRHSQLAHPPHRPSARRGSLRNRPTARREISAKSARPIADPVIPDAISSQSVGADVEQNLAGDFAADGAVLPPR
ncbi:MAG: hypothetical protein KDA79_20150 [Planctomycetaceae bacterium]|nr:hypothetical protein [Planctomycetaceae bacterium]